MPHRVPSVLSNPPIWLSCIPARSVQGSGQACTPPRPYRRNHMSISISDPPQHTPRPVAVWILGVLSALHAAGAFIFVAGGRTPANELEGFVMGITASV